MSTRRHVAGLALIAAGLLAQEWRTTLQSHDLDHPVLRRAMRAVLLPGTSFVPVQPFSTDLAEVWQASQGNLSFFLVKDVDPYRGAKDVHWTAHPAGPDGGDLLKAQYEAAGLQLTLLESANVVTLQVSQPENPFPSAPDKSTLIQELIRKVVLLNTADHKWRYDLPPDLNSDSTPRLITTHNAPPINEIQTRDDRADIVIWNGSLYFVFYSKIAQMDGWAAEDHWFSPEARHSLAR